MSKARVLLADGHDVLRRGLRSLLQSHAELSVCGDAKSGLSAVRMAHELKPDIVIMGLDTPELNGIDAIRQIKREHPEIEVLFYTAHQEEYFIAEALKAGARAHVLKSDSEATLIEAVSALAKHLPYFSTRAAETLLQHIRKTGPEMKAAEVLTEREREIVQLLADGKSNVAIASELHISVKTVEAHRSAVMRKLGFKSVTELVRYAIRNGLIQA
jgi:DNA-binding NarL/FixJ family response regulator